MAFSDVFRKYGRGLKRLASRVVEVDFGTGADQVAPGSKLPGSAPLDTTGAALGQVPRFDGTKFTPADAAGTTATLTTTDATQQTLATYPMADGAVVAVRVTVVAIKSDGSTANAWHFAVGARCQGGAAVLLDTNGLYASDEEATPWDATIDVAGKDLGVRVTGAAATTIKWFCRLEPLAVVSI